MSLRGGGRDFFGVEKIKSDRGGHDIFVKMHERDFTIVIQNQMQRQFTHLAARCRGGLLADLSQKGDLVTACGGAQPDGPAFAWMADRPQMGGQNIKGGRRVGILALDAVMACRQA